MKKLLQGILDYRKHVRPDYRETFAKLALGQSPDALLIACSDSRVVPNLFASTEPGDLFVVRNVGNLVPPSSAEPSSESAALEFALLNLNVRDIIICGHSECGAMIAALERQSARGSEHLNYWLDHVGPALNQFKDSVSKARGLAPHNVLSQINVLQQLLHIKSYPIVRERIAADKLRLHGWWFDIAEAEVLAYETDSNRFVVIDEKEAERILGRLRG